MAVPQAIPFTFQNAAAATGNGSVMDLSMLDLSSLVVLVTISATATVAFEASLDGSAWIALPMVPLAAGTLPGTSVTTATASGNYYVAPGARPSALQVRVRVSAWTSGTVTVTGRATRPARR